MNDEQATQADGAGDGGSWLGVMDKIHLAERQDRVARISRWAEVGGPPHAEVMLGDDPEYMEKIGFWRVPGGVIRIRAFKNGDFDPAERTEISDEEARAIAIAFAHES